MTECYTHILVTGGAKLEALPFSTPRPSSLFSCSPVGLGNCCCGEQDSLVLAGEGVKSGGDWGGVGTPGRASHTWRRGNSEKVASCSHVITCKWNEETRHKLLATWIQGVVTVTGSIFRVVTGVTILDMVDIPYRPKFSRHKNFVKHSKFAKFLIFVLKISWSLQSFARHDKALLWLWYHA